jgi:N-acetylmuramoyl-L-alanine amidase
VCTLRTAKSLENFPFTVAIDPGHGGEETGATAPDGTPEKDLNLKMALKIQQVLGKVPQVKVVLTRTQDETLPLSERVKRAIGAEANLLLSIHHNALPDGRNPLEENGVSAYYYYPYAMPFAQRFQDSLVKQTGFADYGILFDSLHMCRIMEMPAVLLELGFLTHPEDAALCLDEDHQTRVAHAISTVVTSCVKIPNI